MILILRNTNNVVRFLGVIDNYQQRRGVHSGGIHFGEAVYTLREQTYTLGREQCTLGEASIYSAGWICLQFEEGEVDTLGCTL